jgi:hypothetical protein
MTTSIDQSCCEQLEQRDLAHNVHTGWVRVRQAASAGVKGDLMDWTHWGWEYMRQLQETENRHQDKPQEPRHGLLTCRNKWVAQIQSAGCKAQKKSVIGAYNRCWKYLLCAITKMVKRNGISSS